MVLAAAEQRVEQALLEEDVRGYTGLKSLYRLTACGVSGNSAPCRKPHGVGTRIQKKIPMLSLTEVGFAKAPKSDQKVGCS
jgi:hypothetical protein